MKRAAIPSRRCAVFAVCLIFHDLPVSATPIAVHEAVGWKPTAIPLVNFSSDDGTGYGLRFNLFSYDGASVPYHRKYSAQAFFTTKGKWVHRLLMDTPNFRANERLEVEFEYEKEDFANYYGGLSDEALDAKTKDQKTFSQAVPGLKVTWIRDLRAPGKSPEPAAHERSPWRLRTGIGLTHSDVTPNASAGSIITELNPLGADGGLLLKLQTSLRYDTRDNYNNATSGALDELLVEYGIGGGGDFNGARLSFEHRHFQPLLRPFVQDLTFALRAGADLTMGNLPFYEELEMGGSGTVRGAAKARDRGEGRLLFNGELRWRGLPISRQQHIYLGALAFLDAGHIFERGDGPSLDDWRRGAGVGLRLQWHSTIVRADYGSSGDRTGLYITFSQLF